MPAKKPHAAPGRSLSDFAKAKRRASCPVCSLTTEVREQIRTAREKHIQRDVVMEWLRSEVKTGVTNEQITAHVNGHHDS